MLKRTWVVFLLLLVGVGLSIGCGSTTPTGPGDSTGDVIIITIVGSNGASSFSPATAAVKVGQSVAWKNNDSVTHRPILTDVFDTKALASGATSVSFKMTTAGTYDYKCTIHPSETGTVIVTP
jgi:plastocyanin